MAYDYDKVKSQYESLNEQQKQQFASMKGGNVQDFLTRYNAEKSQASTPTKTSASSTPTQTSTSTYPSSTVKPEYQGAGTNRANSYVNQGEGTYKYDEGTKYYEKQGADNYSNIRDKWNSLSYAEQQAKLKENPNLKAGVERVGGTFKTEEATPTTGTTGTKTGTTPADEWDYQDNSPERMAQMADNVNKIYATNPGIFENEDTFKKFFIDGKGRTPEQEAFLMDFYKNRKKYNELDNYTADEIGAMDVHGYVPESYLTYLKNSDPERYAAVMDAKAKEQDKIKDKTALDTTSELSGDSEGTITSKAIEWLKSQGLFLDKDGNLIDDRTENYATDEEKQYAKDAADIIARNLDIDNTVKHTYEDYVKKYPGATKATLMAMAQDTNADLLREKENNNVELTRLQGYMDYMQSERQERNRIGENAINQLQKQFGMYYDYSPQGMSELAQAKYAATNVTLDQADNGTDTQKQMALDAVLTPIYEQYGDIIQRPQAQVINDVMALAKSKGISLSQALEENFMSQLKKKSAYQAMQASMENSGWEIKNIYVDGEQQSVWYNPLTQETKPLGYSYGGDGKYSPVSINDFGEGDYPKNRDAVKNAMREWATQGGSLEGAAKNIAANMEGTYLGLNTCGYYVNDYIYGVTGQQGNFGSEIASKRAACDDLGLKGAKVGDAIVFDRTISPEGISGVLPEYGHVGIITGYNPNDGSLTVSSSVGGKVQEKTIKPGDAWYRNIYGTKHLNYKDATKDYGYGENPMSKYFANLGGGDLNADQKKDLKFVTQSYNLLYRIASSGDLDHLINSGDLEKLIQNMNSKAFQSTEGDKTFSAVKSMLTKNISDQTNLKTIGDIAELITLKLRKESGAAISAGEWASGFESFLPGAGEDYDTSFAKYIRFEQDYLMPSMVYAGGDMSDYKPLFSPNSPYYKKDDSTTGGGTTGVTSKGNWDFNNPTNTYKTPVINGSTQGFDTLLAELGYL